MLYSKGYKFRFFFFLFSDNFPTFSLFFCCCFCRFFWYNKFFCIFCVGFTQGCCKMPTSLIIRCERVSRVREREWELESETKEWCRIEFLPRQHFSMKIQFFFDVIKQENSPLVLFLWWWCDVLFDVVKDAKIGYVYVGDVVLFFSNRKGVQYAMIWILW